MAHSIDRELLHKQADIINQLAIIIRTSMLHSTNNSAVISGIDKFVSLVNEILNHGKNMVLELRGEYFYLNDDYIRYLQGYVLNYDYLIKEFKRAELGTVIVNNTITHEDLRVFIVSFIKSLRSENPFECLANDVAGISCLELSKLKNIVQEDLDTKHLVKKTYFNAVSSYKGIFQTLKSDKTTGLRRVKRVITSIVNQIMKHEQVLVGLTTIKDYNEYTYHHSANVSILSVALGRRLGMNRQMLIDLGIAALFHDIGKIKVPNEILNKPAGLDDYEWRIIMKHPQWGVSAILKMRNVDALTINTALVAFEHHMNINNSGYPQVANPSDLDLFTRIISISDQYDALTSGRIYSEPMVPDKALSYMQEKSGDKLDPVLFRLFVNMMGIYPIGTLVMLDTNELGLVFENNQELLLRPRVMMITDNKGNKVEGHVADLTEKNEKDAYARTIVRTMNPKQYNINLAEYFL